METIKIAINALTVLFTIINVAGCIYQYKTYRKIINRFDNRLESKKIDER